MIPVVVGLLMSPTGKALMARRSAHVSRPTLWEYPGGKVERKETPGDALRREWREELGVAVEVGRLVGECELRLEEHYRIALYQVRLLDVWQHPTCHGRTMLGFPVNDAIEWHRPSEAIVTLPMIPSCYLLYPAVRAWSDYATYAPRRSP